MTNHDRPIFTALEQLRAGWPNQAWSWDGRIPTVSSSFAAALTPTTRALIDQALPRCYSPATMSEAPAELGAIVARSGGLRGDQLAFCDGGATPTAFGLWWPWGGGGTVSLRIGLIGAGGDPALSARLRELYGAEG